MAIQQINLGSAPSGAGGDTQRAANTKINQNFSNQSHAASRLVGTANGQIPLAENLYKAMHSRGFESIVSQGSEADADNLEVGSKVLFPINGQNNPTGDTHWVIHTEQGHATAITTRRQFAMGQTYNGDSDILTRVRGNNGLWSTWRPLSTAKMTYNTTTGAAANVYINSDGLLHRSTSSEKYKNIIAPLQLDDDKYKQALAVKPIIYHSKCEADPINWHYMSFSAEELGAYDPCLTQWKTHDYDDNGNLYELEQKEAEGINLNAICAVLHATNIYQGKKIEELEQRLTALESNNESIE